MSINLRTSIKPCPWNDHKYLRKKLIETMLKYVNFRIFIKLFITSNLSADFEKVK